MFQGEISKSELGLLMAGSEREAANEEAVAVRF